METTLINELINILNDESRTYNDILKISKDKTNIIVAGKVAELESIVKSEQSLVFKVGNLEDKREQVVEKISKHMNIKITDLTISELIKHVKDDKADYLKKYQEDISVTVKELKSINVLNSKLIKNSLDFINFSINLMTSVGSMNNSYGNLGQESGNKKRSLFDRKL